MHPAFRHVGRDKRIKKSAVGREHRETMRHVRYKGLRGGSEYNQQPKRKHFSSYVDTCIYKKKRYLWIPLERASGMTVCFSRKRVRVRSRVTYQLKFVPSLVYQPYRLGVLSSLAMQQLQYAVRTDNTSPVPRRSAIFKNTMCTYF